MSRYATGSGPAVDGKRWPPASPPRSSATPDPPWDLEPFESEHEGYTGNAGNTVEHWYHRAAVVLWPRERTFVIRAKASPLWGIGQVPKTLPPRNPAPPTPIPQPLGPFWATPP